MSTSFAERLEVVRNRIADAGGDPAAVRVVAVTKGHPATAATTALDHGLGDLGESYAQELVAKVDALGESVTPTWHFIGRLQSNKVRLVAGATTWYHSVDRSSLVRALARHDPGALVLVQVDATDEPQKGGVDPARFGELLGEARDAGLDVRGVMAMGHQHDEQRTRAAFVTTAALADRHGLAERSLGMSGDLEAAVAAGATMVRVGTALFGPRPGSPEVEH